MSYITNVILITGSGEEDAIAGLNALFHGGRGFRSSNDDALPRGWYAGDSRLECGILPGAFNYFDEDALVAAIRKAGWIFPESVQLLVKDQDEGRFREVDLNR